MSNQKPDAEQEKQQQGQQPPETKEERDQREAREGVGPKSGNPYDPNKGKPQQG